MSLVKEVELFAAQCCGRAIRSSVLSSSDRCNLSALCWLFFSVRALWQVWAAPTYVLGAQKSHETGLVRCTLLPSRFMPDMIAMMAFVGSQAIDVVFSCFRCVSALRRLRSRTCLQRLTCRLLCSWSGR